MSENDRTGPLARFRVLDLTRVRAGPVAIRQLADWGADVIRVEAPGKQGSPTDLDRHGSDFQNLHRNKRSITLDLKTPRGLELFKRLAESVDVVAENYRPAVKHRLGIDYASLREINPRLVYASVSGFGEDGPYRERPGFDQIAQGMGGLMSITGLPGQGPVRAGIAIADVAAGLYTALGILTALLEREISGEGQWVKSSLLAAQVAILDFQAARYLIKGEVPGQAGNDHPTIIPMGVFKTNDGHVNIAVSGDVMWAKFCAAIGANHLVEDPDYADNPNRSKNRARLNGLLEEITENYSSAELIDLLNEAGVPCGPIYTVDEMFADPQIEHLQMAQPVEHPLLGPLKLVNQPVTLDRTGSEIRHAAPEAGADTDAILAEIGLDARSIETLRADRII